jgi:zinc protease
MINEADRMRHLTLDASEFAQSKVVMEERRLRTDEQATAQPRADERRGLQASLPRPVIGWMNDLENMTVQDAA